MKVYIEFRHGLRLCVEGAEIYKERNYSGETVMIYNESISFILFKGMRGYYLRAPKLWRKPAPVNVLLH
ncbi:MAG: hypothetical protein J7J01_01380 [Methanophagales archaeon]|nr:hypothetical protein [Methanophagales archaeon]